MMTRQANRLKDLIAFARTRSPFYSQRYRALPTEIPDLGVLPPVSKRELMTRFDDWVTNRTVTLDGLNAFLADHERVGHLYQGRYATWTTSGTTGEPGIFVHDIDALKVYASLALWRGAGAWLTPRQVWRLLRRGIRAAAVICTGGHYASASATELVGRAFPSLSENIRAFSVLAPASEMVTAMNEFQPTILVGYPTAMAMLARHKAAGDLEINPTLIVTAAECLTTSDRERIASAFACQVGDLYAASEFMGIALSCSHHQLHVNADWVILEPVDESFEPVQPGQASHTVLLTNLVNRVQPIIRYDLGDSVTVNPLPCPCGSHLPTIQVDGRRDDTLHLRAAGGEAIPMLPMALAAVVEEEPGVQRYQVIQTAPATLSIRVDATSGYDSTLVGEAVARRLHNYLAGQGLPSVQIEPSLEHPRRDPVSGKFRQVLSALRDKEGDHAER